MRDGEFNGMDEESLMKYGKTVLTLSLIIFVFGVVLNLCAYAEYSINGGVMVIFTALEFVKEILTNNDLSIYDVVAKYLRSKRPLSSINKNWVKAWDSFFTYFTYTTIMTFLSLSYEYMRWTFLFFFVVSIILSRYEYKKLETISLN